MSYKDDKLIKNVFTVKQENETIDEGFSNQEAADKLAEYVDERKLADEEVINIQNNAFITERNLTASYRIQIPWDEPEPPEDDIPLEEDTRCVNDPVEDEPLTEDEMIQKELRGYPNGKFNFDEMEGYQHCLKHSTTSEDNK